MKKDKSNVAVNVIWFERFVECSRSQGTPNFVDSVWRFYWSLIDLGEGDFAIKKKVDEYLNDIWFPRVNKLIKTNLENATSESDAIKKDIKDSVNLDQIGYLFNFIIQTIQNSDLGWKLPGNLDEAWDYKDAIE
jgi:hypothetical protein